MATVPRSANLPLILAMLVLTAGCARKREPQSRQDDLPRSPGPIASTAPQKVLPLTPATVDQFLDWAQSVPQSHTDLIKQQVAAVATNPAVVDALSKRLLELPIKDIGRYLMILSVVGESRNPQFIEPLKRFIWSKETLVLQPSGEGKSGSHVSYFEHGRALQARASEMLAFIRTAEAFSGTREIVNKHPAVEVRIAAIDAYLFNHGDSEAAKVELTRFASPDDAKMIGIPRRTRDMNVREFDARLLAFYERYPDEKPPEPRAVDAKGPARQPVIPRAAIPGRSLSH